MRHVITGQFLRALVSFTKRKEEIKRNKNRKKKEKSKGEEKIVVFYFTAIVNGKETELAEITNRPLVLSDRKTDRYKID